MKVEQFDGEMNWYVMRVTYQRELQVKKKLEDMGVKCFVPMSVKMKKNNGNFIYNTSVVLHNFIFVYSTFERILEIKNHEIVILRFMITKDGENQKKIMTVPLNQMERFMLVSSVQGSNIKYYKPSASMTLKLSNGDKVRVTSGPFKGLVGTFVKFKREKSKRVVVEIAGLIGVATEELQPEMIELL